MKKQISHYENWLIEDAFFCDTRIIKVVTYLLDNLSTFFQIKEKDIGTVFITHSSIYKTIKPPPVTLSKHLSQICLPHDYIIVLNCKNIAWLTFVYQLTHEIIHVMAKCFPICDRFEWVSEIFCEMGSFIALKLFFSFPDYKGIRKIKR